MDISYKQPICKNSYYLSLPDKPLTYTLHDIRIYKISRLHNDKGYQISIYVSSDNQAFFQSIDDACVINLISKNEEWFQNNLSADDITNMYKPVCCSQTNTIDILLPMELARIYQNNKSIPMSECINILSDTSYTKLYTVNIEIQNIGMYIYSKQTMNKWIVKYMHIYDLEEPLIDSKEEIELFWKDALLDYDTKLEKDINILEQKRSSMKTLWTAISKEPYMNKAWETKIQEIKKLILH